MSLKSSLHAFDADVISWLCDVARQAGRAIMNFYEGDAGVSYKADDSPITLADRAAHEHIAAQLKARFPQIPLISEEGSMPEVLTRQSFERFWLVDPLDGTKEFIKRNGEFTVNIALIEADRPIFGVVHTPTQDTTYYGLLGKGAFLIKGDGAPKRLTSPADSHGETLRVAVSRSHPNDRLSAFLEQYPGVQTQAVGSSLKFCYVADQTIDLYPRFGPLNEWDTAAAHIVAEESGATVSDLNGEPLRYNKTVTKHQHVLVCRSESLRDQIVAFIKEMPEA